VKGPGKGAIFKGNIFWDNARMFKDLIETTELKVDRCLIESAFHDRGVGNLDADPGFVGPVENASAIPLGSPVLGTGPNGLDMGFLVPAGASIAGEPPTTTWRTEATLVVDGPAIRRYRYRLNGGAWSVETVVEDAIVLSGLSGTNQVEVIGENTVGDWQAEAEATVSRVWVVDPSFARVVLNEIDVASGQVEIWNNSGSDLDLNGFALNGVTVSGAGLVPPGGYFVMMLGELAGNGGAIKLVNAASVEVDVVTFGLQIGGSTLGRFGEDGEWMLTQVTLGSVNVRQATALPGKLKLNEWLFGANGLFRKDFIELYNPEGLPVPLAEIQVEPEPRVSGRSWTAPTLSYIGAEEYRAIFSDGVMGDFEVDAGVGAEIRLWLGAEEIDSVVNTVIAPDVSEGRVPSGGDDFTTFTLPTPGFGVEVTKVETVTPLVAIHAVWAYEDSDTDFGTAWRASSYDDAEWSTGAALLGRETSPQNLPERLETAIDYVSGKSTYYFRHRFQFLGDPARAELHLRTVVDDGAVFYLNGVELHRLRMDDPVGHGVFANDNVGDANYEGPFTLSADGLLVGGNVLAVEVHQDDVGSSDIVFGLELEAVETEFMSEGLGDAEAILAGLRATEIMFHPAGDAAGEFVELRNTGAISFDLGGLRFVEGVKFEFPSMVLAPGEFVYVVKDEAAFGHPELMVVGEYTGELEDAGERLRLELGFGAGVVDVTYAAGVAEGTAGGGNSIELAVEGGLKGSRWVASQTKGGTLGAVSVFGNYETWLNGVFTAAEVSDLSISGGNQDPDGDGLVNELEYYFGSDPKVAGLSEVVLEGVGDDVVLRYPRSVNAIGNLYLATSNDLVGWARSVPGVTGEIVSQDGARQVVELWIPAASFHARFFRIEGE
jgi:hypothetical protein